jgi:hypothetical protein
VSSAINLGYIPDKSGMLDEYPGYIWDISRMYPGYIYIPDKSWIDPKYIPEYILDISGIYSQIYLGFQGWGVLRCYKNRGATDSVRLCYQMKMQNRRTP